MSNFLYAIAAVIIAVLVALSIKSYVSTVTNCPNGVVVASYNPLSPGYRCVPALP